MIVKKGMFYNDNDNSEIPTTERILISQLRVYLDKGQILCTEAIRQAHNQQPSSSVMEHSSIELSEQTTSTIPEKL